MAALVAFVTLLGTIAFLAVASPTDAAPPENALLFTEADAPVDLPANAADDQVGRSRQVTLNLRLLGGAGGAGGPAQSARLIQFNLFSDRKYVARHVATEVLDDGSFVWRGDIPALAFGDITLVIRDGEVTADIRTQEGVFEVRPGKSEIHQLREIDTFKFPEPAEDTIEPDEAMDQETVIVGEDETTAADDGTVVDVMVVYTTQSRRAVGGPTAMQSLIDLSFSQTNDALARSGAVYRFRNVHNAEVSYAESGSASTDINRLRDGNDGYLDEVHTLRDQYGADLVALIVDNFNACGIGQLVGAWSVTADQCATGGMTFAHELGHNLGAHHDWYVNDAQYSQKGYINIDDRWRTVMAYGNRCSAKGFFCARAPHFSNPSISYEGSPTGVPAGTNLACVAGDVDHARCDADNITVMNGNAVRVANFRPTVVGGGGGGTTTTVATTSTTEATTSTTQATTSTTVATTAPITAPTTTPTTTPTLIVTTTVPATTPTTIPTTTTTKNRGGGKSHPCRGNGRWCR